MAEKGTKKPKASFIILSIRNIRQDHLWTKKEQKLFCWDLGKEQKGLKLISLSLVFGTLFDNKEHLWTKREQLFCWELLKKNKT